MEKFINKFTGLDMLKKLDEIDRFNGHFCMKKENVSTHSYWVTVYARLLGELFVDKSQPGAEQFILALVTGALFHDWDEVFTGDVLYDLKYNEYNGHEIKKALKAFIRRKKSEVLDATDKIDGMLGVYMSAPNTEIVKNLLKICDWLSCLKYIYQEVERGNNSMRKMSKKAFPLYLQYVNSFIEALESEGSNLINLDNVKYHLIPNNVKQ